MEIKNELKDILTEEEEMIHKIALKALMACTLDVERSAILAVGFYKRLSAGLSWRLFRIILYSCSFAVCVTLLCLFMSMKIIPKGNTLTICLLITYICILLMYKNLKKYNRDKHLLEGMLECAGSTYNLKRLMDKSTLAMVEDVPNFSDDDIARMTKDVAELESVIHEGGETFLTEEELPTLIKHLRL